MNGCCGNCRYGSKGGKWIPTGAGNSAWHQYEPNPKLFCSHDIFFYQAETEPVLHECKCEIRNAFLWSYEQTVTNVSSVDAMRKHAVDSFPRVRLQKPVWERTQQFFSVPVKPCRKCSRDALRRSDSRLYSDEILSAWWADHHLKSIQGSPSLTWQQDHWDSLRRQRFTDGGIDELPALTYSSVLSLLSGRGLQLEEPLVAPQRWIHWGGGGGGGCQATHVWTMVAFSTVLGAAGVPGREYFLLFCKFWICLTGFMPACCSALTVFNFPTLCRDFERKQCCAKTSHGQP